VIFGNAQNSFDLNKQYKIMAYRVTGFQKKRAFVWQRLQFVFYKNPLYQNTITKKDVYSWIFISTSF